MHSNCEAGKQACVRACVCARVVRTCVFLQLSILACTVNSDKSFLELLALAWLSAGVDSKRSTNLVFAHHYNPESRLESG